MKQQTQAIAATRSRGLLSVVGPWELVDTRIGIEATTSSTYATAGVIAGEGTYPHGDAHANRPPPAGAALPDPGLGHRRNRPFSRRVHKQVADHAHRHRHARWRQTLLAQTPGALRQSQRRNLLQPDLLPSGSPREGDDLASGPGMALCPLPPLVWPGGFAAGLGALLDRRYGAWSAPAPGATPGRRERPAPRSPSASRCRTFRRGRCRPCSRRALRARRPSRRPSRYTAA